MIGCPAQRCWRIALGSEDQRAARRSASQFFIVDVPTGLVSAGSDTFLGNLVEDIRKPRFWPLLPLQQVTESLRWLSMIRPDLPVM
jgi:hypothetical protein